MDGTGKAFHVSIADVVPDAEEGIYTCVKDPSPQPRGGASKSAMSPILGRLLTHLCFTVNTWRIPENDLYLDRDMFLLELRL